MDWDDSDRIQSWEELLDWSNEVGLLPLFKTKFPAPPEKIVIFSEHWPSLNQHGAEMLQSGELSHIL